jgi:hypothetical protein
MSCTGRPFMHGPADRREPPHAGHRFVRTSRHHGRRRGSGRIRLDPYAQLGWQHQKVQRSAETKCIAVDAAMSSADHRRVHGHAHDTQDSRIEPSPGTDPVEARQ